MRLVVAAAVTAALQLATAADAAERMAASWQLVWADELDGPDGSGVDRAKWVPEVGGHGWGNNELQFYRNDLANAHLDDGVLVITAIKERYSADGMTRELTSARLKTQGTFEQAYGRFEARIQVPRGQGIWPAFWMLGNDIGAVGWPACGEIGPSGAGTSPRGERSPEEVGGSVEQLELEGRDRAPSPGSSRGIADREPERRPGSRVGGCQRRASSHSRTAGEAEGSSGVPVPRCRIWTRRVIAGV